ncbi:MAG: caspase family protein [Thermodesulfobacteriota bacterium]
MIRTGRETVVRLLSFIGLMAVLVFTPAGMSWPAPPDAAAREPGRPSPEISPADDGLKTVFQAGHSSPITNLSFNLAGTLLASLDQDGTVKIWEMPGGRLLRSWKTEMSQPDRFGFLRDGRLLMALDQVQEFWDPIRAEKAEAPSEKEIVSSSEGGDLDRWLQGRREAPRFYTPDRSICVVRAAKDQVRVIDSSRNADYLVETPPCGGKTILSPEGSYLACGEDYLMGSGGYLQSWNIFLTDLKERSGRALYDETIRIRTQGLCDGLALSPDGRYLVLNEEYDSTEEYGGRLALFSLKDGRRIWQVVDDAGYFMDVRYGPDGRYIFTSTRFSGEVTIWRPDTGEKVRVIETPEGKFSGGLAVSPDSRWVAFQNPHSSTGRDAPAVLIYQVSSGALAARLAGAQGSQLVFSGDSKLLAEMFSKYQEGSQKIEHRVRIWDIARRRPLKEFKITENEEDWITRGDFAFTLDGRHLLVDHAKWRIADGRMVERLPVPERDLVWGSAVRSGDGRLYARVGLDGAGVDIWDQGQGRLLATLFNTSKGSLALTPEGFFSGTGDFDRHVHFVKADRAYDFNQFYDSFYRPDLVEKKLSGEDISRYQKGLDIRQALNNPPPEVSILSPVWGATVSNRALKVKVRVKDQGGGIGDIRLYHNGKLVHSRGIYRIAAGDESLDQAEQVGGGPDSLYRTALRDLTMIEVRQNKGGIETGPTEASPLTGTVERTFDLDLIKGDNTVSAAAFNSRNTVMSALRTVETKAEVPEKQPRLFALIVGNAHFSNSKFDLAMPIKDARDFAGLIQKTARPLFADLQVKVLADGRKKDILAAVQAMSGLMAPEDVFVFFVASHGLAEDDLYYLIASDFDGSRGSLKTASLSSLELMEFSKVLPPLRQLYILDTCHSGGLGAVVAGLYDARISVLAKALGMHIWAAAQLTQSAADEYDGNGLFTHFVLKGLKGQADGNKDKKIGLLEMTPFLKAGVKQASRGEQEAFIRNFGDDLIISEVPGNQ